MAGFLGQNEVSTRDRVKDDNQEQGVLVHGTERLSVRNRRREADLKNILLDRVLEKDDFDRRERSHRHKLQ